MKSGGQAGARRRDRLPRGSRYIPGPKETVNETGSARHPVRSAKKVGGTFGREKERELRTSRRKRLQYRRVTQNVLMISQKEITNGCSSHVLILVLLEDAGYASEDTENTLQFLT